MTRETYAKAGSILQQIETNKRELEKVSLWQKNESTAFRGIRIVNVQLQNEVIHPCDFEINTMLLMMKERLQKNIANFEKELEELK